MVPILAILTILNYAQRVYPDVSDVKTTCHFKGIRKVSVATYFGPLNTLLLEIVDIVLEQSGKSFLSPAVTEGHISFHASTTRFNDLETGRWTWRPRRHSVRIT